MSRAPTLPIRPLLVTVVAIATLVIPQSSRAATVEFTARGKIDVVDPDGEGPARWEPAKQPAAAGDTIVWHFGENAESPSGVRLDLEIYATDGEYFSVDDPSGDVTRSFAGGTVWFRSTSGSGLTPQGICSGMCGAYTSIVTPPDAPTITHPVSGSEIGGRYHSVSGTAQPFTIIRLTEGTSLLREAMVGGTGTWSFEGVNFPKGTHTIAARSVDALDRISSIVSTTFTMIDDGGPTITLDTPDPAIFLPLEEQSIEGSASDTSSVASVVVRVHNVSGTLEETVPASCVGGCNGASVRFSYDIGSRLPGYWYLVIVARDTWGNESTRATYVIKV